MEKEGQVERTQRAGHGKERDYARPSRALGILVHHVGHHSSAILPMTGEQRRSPEPSPKQHFGDWATDADFVRD
jgi:hypothetical protein